MLRLTLKVVILNVLALKVFLPMYLVCCVLCEFVSPHRELTPCGRCVDEALPSPQQAC